MVVGYLGAFRPSLPHHHRNLTYYRSPNDACKKQRAASEVGTKLAVHKPYESFYVIN